jgi:hypothetical protein
MSDLIRGLIRWILVILLAILVIFLIIKVANRNKVKTTKKEEPAPIVTIRDKEDTVEDNTQLEQSTLVVDTADTGATDKASIIIGMLILGTTTYFIYKNRLEKE